MREAVSPLGHRRTASIALKISYPRLSPPSCSLVAELKTNHHEPERESEAEFAIRDLWCGAATDDSADDATNRELGEQQAIVTSAEHVDSRTDERDGEPEGEISSDDLRSGQGREAE